MDPSPAHSELTPQCWAHVFSQLSARDAARAACVQKLWRDLIQQDEHLWRRFMEDDLGLSEERHASGARASSYRAAYCSWRLAYGAEYWPFLPRAIKAWDLIKGWLAVHYPDVSATIREGLTEAEIAAVEERLGFKLSPALKVLYRLHDGQLLKFDLRFDRENNVEAWAPQQAEPAAAGGEGSAGDDKEDDEASSIFHGLFGGYSVYNHMVVTRMMPLKRAEVWRTATQLHIIGQKLLPFACSFRVFDKMFVVDAESGNMSIIRRRLHRCSLQAVHKAPAGVDNKDGVLRWFEEYARRLAGGWYEVAPMDEDHPADSRAISLFPLAPPDMMEVVTKGVRVRASVVYAPEGHPTRHMFAYSIRFALLDSAASAGAGGVAAAQPLAGPGAVQQCQLVSRHWIIRGEQGQQTDEVRGEGVIGKYPILLPGQPDFVYCSCTHQEALQGSMEGEFRFVEGTIDRQVGPSFDVVCPTFRLHVPEFTF